MKNISNLKDNYTPEYYEALYNYHMAWLEMDINMRKRANQTLFQHFKRSIKDFWINTLKL